MERSAKLYLIIVVFAIFLLSGSFDPDYEAYRVIFESGWGSGGRDPAFFLLIASLHETLSYEQFRFFMCCIFGAATFVLATRLGAMSLTGRLGVASALALTPFIFLKLHVQIREGIALLLWLFAVTKHGGNISRNVRTKSFWIMALISIGTHLSMVIWWVAASVLGSKKPVHGLQAFLLLCLFALIGFSTTTAGSKLLVSHFGGIFFVESADYVKVTFGKQLYWVTFLIFPVSVLIFFRSRALTLPRDILGTSGWSPSIFGMLGVYGLLGFFPVALMGVFVWGTSDTDFNLAIRTAITLMIFLGLQLSLTCSGKIVTWAALWFIFLAVGRLLFFPG